MKTDSDKTMYADDFTLTLIAPQDIFHETICRDLQLIDAFLRERNMGISPKSKFMQFSLSKRRDQWTCPDIKVHENCSDQLNCNCPCLERVKEYKYLGLTVDETLSWTPHVTNLANDMRRLNRKLFYMRTVCPPNIMRLLYFSLCRSKILFAITVWGKTHSSGPLERLHRKIAKTCMLSDYTDLSVLYKRKIIMSLVRLNPVYTIVKCPRESTMFKIHPPTLIRTQRCSDCFPFSAYCVFNQLNFEYRQMFFRNFTNLVKCMNQPQQCWAEVVV